MTDNLAAQRLLARLRNDGLTLTAKDGRLWVSPTEAITADQATAIRASRDALYGLVVAEGGNCPGYPPLPPPADLWGRQGEHTPGVWAGNITRESARPTSAGCDSHGADGSLSLEA